MRVAPRRGPSRPFGALLLLCAGLILFGAACGGGAQKLLYKTTTILVKKQNGNFSIPNSDKSVRLNKGNHDLIEWSLDASVGAVDSASVIFTGETPFASPYFDISYAPAYSGRIVVAPNASKTYSYEIRIYVGGSATPSLADPGIIID